uniref:Uncharacterized protein n=1 Tax=Setaria italica TaxID=4555 RepID=K4AHB3_SETIT
MQQIICWQVTAAKYKHECNIFFFLLPAYDGICTGNELVLRLCTYTGDKGKLWLYNNKNSMLQIKITANKYASGQTSVYVCHEAVTSD